MKKMVIVPMLFIMKSDSKPSSPKPRVMGSLSSKLSSSLISLPRKEWVYVKGCDLEDLLEEV